MIRVIFICKGNICRSPMAEAIFRHMVHTAGLSNEIEVDSAGIREWHVGKPPHPATIQVLKKHSIPYNGLLGRQVQEEDLHKFDHIVAMDEQNMAALKQLGTSEKKMFRLLELVDSIVDKNVPDPYYDGQFDRVYELIELGCKQLLLKIKKEHSL